MISVLERPEVLEQSVYDRYFFDIVNSLVSDLPPEEVEQNVWQQLQHATNDVITPANVLDAAAFGLSLYGIKNLDSWKGIGASALSFSADLFDGKLARATGTSSALGEAVDAGGDKVKLALALYQIAS